MKKLLLATTFLFILVSSYAQSTSTISVDRKNSDGTTSNEVMVVSGKEGDAILEKLKNDPSVTNINVNTTESKTTSSTIHTDGDDQITINVDASGDGENKKIKIITKKDGEEEVVEWDGKGEHPEAMKKLLENKDIDFMMLDGDNLQLMNGNTSNVYQYSFDNNNKAVLGVYTEDTVDGVSITSFTDSSAAEKAGLRRGDIITKINDTHIATMQGLVNALSPFNPGEKVSVKYIRNGKEKKSKVKLRASS